MLKATVLGVGMMISSHGEMNLNRNSNISTPMLTLCPVCIQRIDGMGSKDGEPMLIATLANSRSMMSFMIVLFGGTVLDLMIVVTILRIVTVVEE